MIAQPRVIAFRGCFSGNGLVARAYYAGLNYDGAQVMKRSVSRIASRKSSWPSCCVEVDDFFRGDRERGRSELSLGGSKFHSGAGESKMRTS